MKNGAVFCTFLGENDYYFRQGDPTGVKPGTAVWSTHGCGCAKLEADRLRVCHFSAMPYDTWLVVLKAYTPMFSANFRAYLGYPNVVAVCCL